MVGEFCSLYGAKIALNKNGLYSVKKITVHIDKLIAWLYNRIKQNAMAILETKGEPYNEEKICQSTRMEKAAVRYFGGSFVYLWDVFELCYGAL